MADNDNNNMAGSSKQLVECPRCRHRFELSETFRAQFDEEKSKAIDIAVRESAAGIRAEVERASQEELAERDRQVKKLEKQLEINEKEQNKR